VPLDDTEVTDMNVPRRLPLAATGAAVALVMAGTVVAAAHGPGGDRQSGFGDGPGRGAARAELRGFGPFGPFGDRLGLGLDADGVVRNETIVDLGEAGFLTRRVDSGTVTGAGETELSYTLATGETATVTTDEDTEILALTEVSQDDDGGLLRRRMLTLDEVTLADIPADAEIVVWSEAGEAGTFVAQRIIVQPAADAQTGAADEAAPTDEAPSATPAV
jgi:hypothetical protein